MKKSILFFLIIFSCSILFATIINVPDDQPTIQAGINVADNSDTVLVHPGLYFENINYNGKNIIVASLFLTTQDTTYISDTIIDGNQNGTVIIFENGESSDAILCGFTIMNDFKPTMSSGGGGIYILNSNPHLHDLIISANFATSGGGIYSYNACPILNNLIIINNEVPSSTGRGGGIYLMDCDKMTIKNLSIINNETGGHGSGLFLDDCESLIFENVIVSNNECGYMGGGALYFQNSDAIILNSTIYHNNNQYSGGGLTGGYNVHLVNSIVYGNSEPQLEIDHLADYSLIQGGFPGIGNIDAEPFFVNAILGDFHLQDSSPCIGSGIDEIEINGITYFAPEFDLKGNPRPAPTGSMPDMGVYENLLGVPQVGIYNNQLPSTNFNLSNYPNPFNPTTTISFSLQNNSNVEISIYNIKGQKVKTLLRDQFPAGQHSVVWDGRDENNLPLGSGIFFYQLRINGNSKAINKMILIK